MGPARDLEGQSELPQLQNRSSWRMDVVTGKLRDEQEFSSSSPQKDASGEEKTDCVVIEEMEGWLRPEGMQSWNVNQPGREATSEETEEGKEAKEPR